MKKKIVILVVILCLIYVLDSAASHIFVAVFSQPTDWNNYVKSARQMVNALLLYTAFISYFRLSDYKLLPNINFKQLAQHGIAGFSGSFFFIFLCLILTPEFYSAKSGFRLLSFDQIFMPFTIWVGGAIIEEVIYRGIVQRFLEWLLPTYIAIFIQVSLFVYSHNPNILGHSSPIFRTFDLFAFGLLATCMAKKSSYLILPIFFHFGENFFTELIRGQYAHGWDIPGIWVYQDNIRLTYRPFFYFAACVGGWYWWQKRGQNVAALCSAESAKKVVF